METTSTVPVSATLTTHAPGATRQDNFVRTFALEFTGNIVLIAHLALQAFLVRIAHIYATTGSSTNATDRNAPV